MPPKESCSKNSKEAVAAKLRKYADALVETWPKVGIDGKLITPDKNWKAKFRGGHHHDLNHELMCDQLISDGKGWDAKKRKAASEIFALVVGILIIYIGRKRIE